MHRKRATVIIAKLPDSIIYGVFKIDRCKLQIDAAYAAILKQVLDEHIHPGRCSNDLVQVFPALLIEVFGAVLLERFSKAYDSPQRSAQVMRDRVGEGFKFRIALFSFLNTQL